MASALYEAKREAIATVAVWTVHIHFDAFQSLPAKDFYWATADGIELEDGNIYERQLAEIPRGRHQRDRGNDYAEIVVSNPDNALYQELRPYEDIIERGHIIIRECFEIETDFYESEIRLDGYLKDFTHNHADSVLNITVLSDMSRPGFWVGNRILTRERCGTEFNFNGANSPLTHICGWQTTQGGNALSCTKLMDGPDGCKAHNNAHRFFAVPALATADVSIIPPGSLPGDDDTGMGNDTDPCFTERVYMLMDLDMNVLPMNEVRVGMKHVGFDVADSSPIESMILKVFVHPTDHFWNAQFESGLIETAHNHLFYTGSYSFVPVAFLGDKPTVGMDFQKKPATSRLLNIEKVFQDDMFYEFHTSAYNYIITDKDKHFFYFVHNLKRFPIFV